MKVISTIRQAILRTIFVLMSMPAVTWAGVKIDSNIIIDQESSLKIFSLFMSAFVGGVSSLFIHTSFDENMKYPKLAKIWIGTFLGAFSGFIILDQSSLGMFTIILPTFVIASLGAPIMVFYLMWLSSSETQAEIKEQIIKKVKDKLGVEK